MQEKLPFDIQSGVIDLSHPSTKPGNRRWVDFKREFHSEFKIAVSVCRFNIDQDPTGNFDVQVRAVDISPKGFWMELEENGRVKAVTATWVAHTV